MLPVWWSVRTCAGKCPRRPAAAQARAPADASVRFERVSFSYVADATEPASFAGWEGGRGIINEQAVYAVQKDTHAVLVWSNQQQTFKSEQIAQEAIANLGL